LSLSIHRAALTRGLGFLLALLASAISAGAQASESTLHSIIDLLQKPQYLSKETAEYQDVLSELLAKSASQLALNLNNGIRPNSINFLLVAADVNERADLPILLLTPTAQSILHNCNYVGLDNTVVCSQDFIDAFFDTYLKKDADVHYLPGKEPPRPDVLNIPNARRAFLFWVLGHELGHLAHGDLDSHFGSQLGLQDLAKADELQQDKELRADSYCADLLVKPPRLAHRITYPKIFIQNLIALANDEVITRHLKKGEGPGLLRYYSLGDLITYESNSDHPEYVIRAVRLLKIVADLMHDEALTAMTQSFEEHLRQTSPPSSH
jgi:hypothetical protein